MELAAQIKKYRKELSLSQDELAERIFVSRQSVSNWENGKTYPDLKSLLMLSEVFSVSLDDLVKGDLKTMKQEIDAQERAKFQRESNIFSTLFILMIFSPMLLVTYLNVWGTVIWGVLAAVCLYYAFRVEKMKKKHDIQTYREILAFSEGKTLDEIEKAREQGKRPYQKILLVVASAMLGAAISVLVGLLAVQ